MSIKSPWSASVEIALEGQKITHGCHGIVENGIHATIVNGRDSISEIVDCAIMLVEERMIQGTVGIGRPWYIYER